MANKRVMPNPNLRFVSRMAFGHFMRFTTLRACLGIHGRYVIMIDPDRLEKNVRFVFGLLIMLAVSSAVSFGMFLDYGIVHFSFCLIVSVLFALFAVCKGDEAYEKLRCWLSW